MISEDFPPLSEDFPRFPKLFLRLDESSRTFYENFRKLPKIAEDLRGRPNEFKYNLTL